ncbi:DEKNAAC100612 [Brettanomyces naardenensis]|uniref:DEKNAAC100612 n=1 Tax=Brettanomyces naardenensis TaxID=13370 RepID=A0A448YFB2_BRENA|nr:DEKNAAC100612 [Brettanomyces naardenensis]
MSGIPSNVREELDQLMTGLLSPDNSIRAQAEACLNRDWTKKDNIDVLLVFLASQAAQGANDTLRAFAAVLFRRFAIKSPASPGYSVTARQIDHVSDGAKQEVRNVLLQGFLAQQSGGVRHKLSDAIAEVSKDESCSWPELLPMVIQAAQNSDANFRDSAFRMITAAPEIISSAHGSKQQEQQVNDTFMKMFGAGFVDQSDAVRISACIAFVSFFENMPKSQWGVLSQLLPNLLDSLPRLLETGNDTALASVLESLIELVALASKIFKPMFPTLIEFCSAVAKNRELDSAARLAALELLTTFCESSPNMCKREPTYAPAIVLDCLQLSTEVCEGDDDCEDWINSKDLDEDEDEETYNAARLSLDRAALKLGGETLAQPLFQYLPSMLQSADWHERQGALMSLSSATEGCRDVLITEIPRILDLLLPALQDPHPRVQYACCNALGQISTDFADVIQRTAGDRVLPALVSMLSIKNVARVQAHAAAALVNFCEEASQQVLEPYLDGLLSNLLSLLQSAPKRYVQEQVVTTIAIVADAAENRFIKYYDTLMPLLLDILRAESVPESRLLKAKAIECATLVALAVGKEKFSQNAAEILQIMTNLQQNLQGDDDPVRAYLQQGWSRVCRLIGKDFLPYLPLVLPPLLDQARATQDISIVEEDDLEEVEQNEDYEVIQLSGKHIAVHTAVLDDKTGAIELLRNYADVLGADFYPYVDQIANEIVIPGLDFYLHDGVRGTCGVTMPSLLQSCIAATGGNKSPQAVQLWNRMVDKLIHQLGNDPVPDLFVAYLYAITKGLEIMGPNALSDTQLSSLAKAIETCFSETYERVKAKESGDDEYNEEVAEDDEDYTDEELLDQISKGLNAVFKDSHYRFLPAFQTIVPTLATLINDDTTSLKLAGLSAASDLVEYGGSESFQLRDLFLNPVGEALTAPQASIRQIANYTVGACAQHGGEQYLDYCLACLPSMTQMASIPDAKAEENLGATENACASIAKIIHSFGSHIQGLDELIQSWFKLLPVAQDDEAAPYAYMLLVELIQQQHPTVMSQIPKVFDDVLQALLYSSVNGKTAEKVVSATRQLLGTLPHDQAMALLGKYDAASKQVIQRWFS